MSTDRPEFSQDTWVAFRRFALGGHPATEVAHELGVHEKTVIKTKSRVLSRLRQEASGILE